MAILTITRTLEAMDCLKKCVRSANPMLDYCPKIANKCGTATDRNGDGRIWCSSPRFGGGWIDEIKKCRQLEKDKLPKKSSEQIFNEQRQED